MERQLEALAVGRAGEGEGWVGGARGYLVCLRVL